MKRKYIDIRPDSIDFFLMYYPRIIEVIRLAASQPDVQNEAFPKQEYPPEEVGFEVEYALQLTESLVNNAFLSKDYLDCMSKLDKSFTDINADEWTVDAMYNSPDWKRTREIAEICLEKLSIEYARPNLYWYKSVKTIL